jgi:hypothetical protein
MYKRTLTLVALMLALFLNAMSVSAADFPITQKITIQKKVTLKPPTQSAGVDGAHFQVYDITDLMNEQLEALKSKAEKQLEDENKKLNDGLEKSSDEAIKSIETETADEFEAESHVLTLGDIETISSDELKASLLKVVKQKKVTDLNVFAQGVTQTNNGVRGLFEFTVPVKQHEYRAYYIVNDHVDNAQVSISEPLVLITPQFDEAGVILKNVAIFPKSTFTPKIEILRLPDTGIQSDFISKIVSQLMSWLK